MKYFLVFALLFAVCSAFPNRDSRIINGRDARPGEAPYMVQIQIRNETSRGQMCGGAIVTPTRVVSAAHCFTWNWAARWSLVAIAGQHNWRVESGNEQERSISRIVNHPQYNPNSREPAGWDINFFEVSEPFVYNEWVQPIALPNPNVMHTGPIQIYGWGATIPAGGGIPDILQTTTKTIIEPELCDAMFEALFGRPMVHEFDMCAGPLDASTDSCGGDSGGPLVQENAQTGELELVAVVAWGSSPCNAVNFPSVNTRTSPFIDFLKQT
jgi:secreted trypsin-like serine protease